MGFGGLVFLAFKGSELNYMNSVSHFNHLSTTRKFPRQQTPKTYSKMQIVGLRMIGYSTSPSLFYSSALVLSDSKSLTSPHSSNT